MLRPYNNESIFEDLKTTRRTLILSLLFLLLTYSTPMDNFHFTFQKNIFTFDLFFIRTSTLFFSIITSAAYILHFLKWNNHNFKNSGFVMTTRGIRQTWNAEKIEKSSAFWEFFSSQFIDGFDISVFHPNIRPDVFPLFGHARKSDVTGAIRVKCKMVHKRLDVIETFQIFLKVVQNDLAKGVKLSYSFPHGFFIYEEIFFDLSIDRENYANALKEFLNVTSVDTLRETEGTERLISQLGLIVIPSAAWITTLLSIML